MDGAPPPVYSRKDRRMKIAVTSSGATLDSPVDPRFGWAAAFILLDTEKGA
jgi:predicted Fe-Mo cluster-binding NifX family protein